MRFEDSIAAVAVDSHHGIYIAKVFAERYKDDIIASGYPKEDLSVLLIGPDHPDYVEVWSELFPITLTDSEGNKFVFGDFGEDSDVWELTEEEYKLVEWDEL